MTAVATVLSLLLTELWLNYKIVKTLATELQKPLWEKLKVLLKMEICIPSHLIPSISYRGRAIKYIVLEGNKEGRPFYPTKPEA